MERLLIFGLRDLSYFALTAGLWWLDSAVRGRGGTLAFLCAIGTGLASAWCGFLLHEWGHLCGALLARAKVALPKRLFSTFLFFFDVRQNGRREFLWMSYGGYLASMLALSAFALFMPRDTLSGQVAVGTAMLGALATLALELPTTVRVFSGQPLPQRGPAYVAESTDSSRASVVSRHHPE